MRAKILLLKASCILLSAVLICGKSASLAYCQEIAAVFTNAHPEFINTMWLDMHRKSIIAGSLLIMPQLSNYTLNKQANNTDKNTITLGLIKYIIAKNNQPADSNKTTSTAAVNETIAAPTAVDAIQANVTKEIEITVNEQTSNEAPALNEEELDPLINKYAEMISVEPHDISNFPLYRFIDKWYGTRYKWGGKDSKGIDCSAFSQKLYSDIYGYELRRTSKQQHKSCERIRDYSDANEGDLIFFRIHRLRISHVGVYLANGFFVHASRSHGIMISSLNDRYWNKRYAGCGRVEKEFNPSAESDYSAH